jgi:hypothetical protein
VEQLKNQLEALLADLPKTKQVPIRTRLADLFSVYPFNEFEFLIASLMGHRKITLDDYHLLRDEYLARNMYLYLFEMTSPRGFGESWAQGHLKELVPELVKPSRKLDPDYSGQYDFLLEGKIRIEVKASRAVDVGSEEALYVKALSSDSSLHFDMNFQQIKPECADVFVWIGVWRDKIRYWVLSSAAVAGNKYYSDKQHRGNAGEGQLHLTDQNISAFAKYETDAPHLLERMRSAHGKKRKSKP